jgi:aspartyl-tRNA(Asn)/glutamyl-tRNA(Gln) amidotransferase subunit A
VLTAGAAAAAWGALGPHPAAAAENAGTVDELAGLTLARAAKLIKDRDVSPVELTRACLDRIRRFDPLLHAFITVREEEALAEARAMEKELREGRPRSPLHGIPVAVKDNIDTAGIRTTAASDVFRDRVPSEDAEPVRRLKAAGAILLGKTNLHELAYGGNADVTRFGTMRNPWNTEHVTGGSSGGSGAAVAADLCYAALGTDTAGSVRIPASHCGIVGLKPTYGLVGTRGVVRISWTLDHVGPMCKSVEDAALMLGTIAGYDPTEPTSVDRPPVDYLRALGMRTAKLRLGIPRASFYDDLDSEVAAAVAAGLDVLRGITAGARDVELPKALNGARLWGPEAYVINRRWITESPERFFPSTRASLERYAHADAVDYIEARRELDVLRRQMDRVFADVDLLITPVMRVPPPRIADGGGSGAAANAAAIDVFGLPAISVPCGFTRSGLPIGLQIVGAPFGESTVLAAAHAYEQATDWHTRKPRLAASGGGDASQTRAGGGA